MKLEKIVDKKFQKALNNLLQQNVPLKTAFKLRGLNNRVKEEIEKYEHCRHSALNKYGRKDANGKLEIVGKAVQFETDGMDKFLRELGELGSVDVDVGHINIADLGDDVALSVEDLEALDPVIS